MKNVDISSFEGKERFLLTGQHLKVQTWEKRFDRWPRQALQMTDHSVAKRGQGIRTREITRPDQKSEPLRSGIIRGLALGFDRQFAIFHFMVIVA